MLLINLGKIPMLALGLDCVPHFKRRNSLHYHYVFWSRDHQGLPNSVQSSPKEVSSEVLQHITLFFEVLNIFSAFKVVLILQRSQF